MGGLRVGSSLLTFPLVGVDLGLGRVASGAIGCTMTSSIPSPRRLVDVVLTGHLNVIQVESSLGRAEPQLGSGGVGLVIDCTHMTGYERDARAAFVTWFRAHRESLSRTAIVTDNTMYKMVVSTMSLATGHPMRVFATRDEAEGWLQIR